MKKNGKTLNGYEGKYQVSNLGNVKSLQYKRLGKERILIPYISNRGYYTVALSMNSKKSVRTIHRLVAETFVDNIDDLPMVNHIDGDKLNNNANNLEWCTQKYNVRHAWENGLTKTKELKTELETYKKIAEKLADYIMDIYESRMNLEIITGLGGELTFKDVIDWAKGEVLKDE